MKKNVMMRVASALLVAVLMTTCAISGTFAKYTTTDSTALETARVAKWGVTVDAIGETAFLTNYEGGDVISSETGVKVVAPGTEGTLGGIAIDGKPEVKVEVTVTADLTLTGWEIDGVEYCPIVFTVGGNTLKIDGTNIKTVAELEAAVEKVFSDLSGTVEANSDLLAAKDVTVSWAWAFRTGDSDDVKNANDVKDTALGNLAAQGSAPTISFECSVGVTQVGD